MIRLLDLLYNASRILFPEFGREFVREDTEIHRETFIDLRAKMDTNSISLRSKVLGSVYRVRDKVTTVRNIPRLALTTLSLLADYSVYNLLYRRSVLSRAI